MEIRKKVWFYGFNAENEVVGRGYLFMEQMDVRSQLSLISHIKNTHLDVREVYSIDDYYGLYNDYMKSFKSASIEEHTIFKVMVENVGKLEASYK